MGAAFDVAPGDPGFADLRDEFLNRYEQRMTLESRVFTDIWASLAELDAMSDQYVTRLGPCHPRIMQRAIRLYGSFAALNMTFRNEHLQDEGFAAPPPFASYAALCAASSEGTTIADQMMADFK